MPIALFVIFSIIGVLVGEAVSSYLKHLCISVFVYIIAIFFANKNRNILVVTIATIFFVYTGFSAIHIKNNTSFLEYDGKNIKITANVIEKMKQKDDLYFYKIKTKSVTFKKQTKKINKNLLLVTDKDLFDKDDIYGIELKINGKVKIPSKNRNFYGFNYKRYLDSQRIYGTVFSKGCTIKIGEKTKSNVLIEAGNSIRYKILDIINKMIGKDKANLLKGILISYVQEIDADTVENFRNLGLAHILCASGINIVYITILVKKVLKLLKRRQRFINSFLIVIVILYNLVVGFNPSITRAVIMAVITFVGNIFFYNARSMTNLGIGAVILIFINPYVIYNVAFQFSFIATLFLILFTDTIENFLDKFSINKVLKELISTSIAVYIGILPIEVYNFNKISVFSVLINIIIGTAHSAIIFIGIIMVAVGNISYILAKPIALVEEGLINFILVVTEKLKVIPFMTINAVYIKGEYILVYYCVILCIYFYNKRDSVRTFILQNKGKLAFLVVFMLSINFFVPKNFTVDFIDVGQGDCAIIKTVYGKNILVDGGEKVNILDIVKNDVTKIDIMIATHGHMDHIGGLLDVITKMKVKELIIPDCNYMGEMYKLLNLVDKEKTKIYRCTNNDTIKIDKYTYIEFLNPPKNSQLIGENDNSLVFKLRYKDISFLFTGDLTKNGEENVLRYNIKSDVLKVGHHGSEYGTTARFLGAVAPKISVISVGENNKFNHPAKIVLNNLKCRKIPIFRTDKYGQIRVITDGKKIKVKKCLE